MKRGGFSIFFALAALSSSAHADTEQHGAHGASDPSHHLITEAQVDIHGHAHGGFDFDFRRQIGPGLQAWYVLWSSSEEILTAIGPRLLVPIGHSLTVDAGVALELPLEERAGRQPGVVSSLQFDLGTCHAHALGRFRHGELFGQASALCRFGFFGWGAWANTKEGAGPLVAVWPSQKSLFSLAVAPLMEPAAGWRIERVLVLVTLTSTH